jgi:TRAP-type C4-dicarboxylate transport system substrate-binding protein
MTQLHIAGYQPARSVHTRALHALRESAAARSGGALRVEITDDIVSQGHRAADLLALVESGELDGCYFASSYLAGRIPPLCLFDRPFQAGPRDAVFAGLDGDTGTRLADAIAGSTGFHVLGWWDNGIRHISNAVRPIRKPADCAGLRLRTLDNAQHQAAFRRIGFEPRFIDVAELPGAVAEGRVDAQENPLTNMVNFNLQLHHKHVSLTGHLLGIAPLLVNRQRYQALSPHEQGVLQAAARDCEAQQRAMAIAEDVACLRVLMEAGVTVVPAHAIDFDAFQLAADSG